MRRFHYPHFNFHTKSKHVELLNKGDYNLADTPILIQILRFPATLSAHQQWMNLRHVQDIAAAISFCRTYVLLVVRLSTQFSVFIASSRIYTFQQWPDSQLLDNAQSQSSPKCEMSEAVCAKALDSSYQGIVILLITITLLRGNLLL